MASGRDEQGGVSRYAHDTQVPAAARLWIAPARDGADCLFLRGDDGHVVPLYSRVDPQRAAVAAVRRAREGVLAGASRVVILGVGLGYHLRALAEIPGLDEILAIEPDARLHREAEISCRELAREGLRVELLGPARGDELAAADRERLDDFLGGGAVSPYTVGERPSGVAVYVTPHLERVHPLTGRLTRELAHELGSTSSGAEMKEEGARGSGGGEASPVRPLTDARPRLLEHLRANLAAVRRAGLPEFDRLEDGEVVFSRLLAPDSAWSWIEDSGGRYLVATRGPRLDPAHEGGPPTSTPADGSGGRERGEACTGDVPLGPGPLPGGLAELARSEEPLLLANIVSAAWLLEFHRLRPRAPLGMRPSVTVVLTSAELLVLLLASADLTALLEDPTWTWFIGDGWAGRVIEHARRRPMWPLPQRNLAMRIPGEPAPDLQPIVDEALRQRARDLEMDLEGMAAHCADREAERWRAWAEARPPGRPRVLIVTSRFTTVLRHVAGDLQRAFSELGCPCELIMEATDAERIGSAGYARAIARFRPDCLVQIDGMRPHFPWLDGRIPYICWAQDRLPRLFDTEITAQLGERDIVFGMWPAIVEELRAHGVPRVELLAPGFDAETYGGPAQVRPEFRSDIALVSHVERPEFAPIPGLVDAVRQEVAQHGWGFGRARHYCTLRERLERRLGFRVSPEHRSRFEHRLYVEVERYIMRTEIARWALELGVEVALYGKGWSDDPELRSHARGVVPAGAALRDLYASATLHLHVNSDTNLHQRVFECLASGGAILAAAHPSDRAPGGLGEHLEIGTEVLTFEGRTEFESQARRVIAEPELRAQLRRAGRGRVLREHTMRARAEQILRTLERRSAAFTVRSEGCPAQQATRSSRDRERSEQP